MPLYVEGFFFNYTSRNNRMKELGIGLLGFGTVGAGVVDSLQRNGRLLADRSGVALTVKGIADLDIESDRGVAVDASLLTTDAEALIAREDIDVVVELIGGTGVARTLALQALALGKPVVTANKALLAEHGAELFAAAKEHGADLFYEASVAGGIPIIKALREGLVINRVDRMYGIMNGTCNYILTRMEREGLAFEGVLKEAQALGFAEAEPSLDVDGWDTAHKAVILGLLAYGCPVTLNDVYVEGIRHITREDIHYALELGYRIKLLAVIKEVDGQVELRVAPTLIPLDHLLASVNGVFNAVLVRGDIVDDTLYYGKGAGRYPTASAVVADLADVARNYAANSSGRIPPFVAHSHYGALRPIEEISTRSYLRMSLKDEPGVLARVTQLLGEQGISISAMVQKGDAEDGYAPVIFLTHAAQENQFRAALEKIDALDAVNKSSVRLRIEDCT